LVYINIYLYFSNNKIKLNLKKMEIFTNLGRYLLAIPLAVFGYYNLTDASSSLARVPHWLPGGTFWVYFIGVCLIAAAVSIVTGKYSKIASILVAVLMLVFVLTVYLPKVLDGDSTGMTGLLKDLAIAGGALIYADKQS
jgi:putative oxidoreductase